MRKGFNPHKDKPQQDMEYFHHVIIPVYLPDEAGYFVDGLQILKYCLTSLLKTVHSKTFITVVNNGSSEQVRKYLDELHALKRIQELIHTTNIGKINAVTKGLVGHLFPLVTISDADVLFLNGWQKETYKVFNAFPKAGAICPTPSSKSFRTFTYNIWFDLFFSKKLQFTAVKNRDALTAFAESIGNSQMYNKHHLENYMTVEAKGIKAVVGAGHYLTTYKSEVFEPLPAKHSNYFLGGISEREMLDVPVIKKGFWRLSTEDNFAYHMGNVAESWMETALEDILDENHLPEEPLNFGKQRSSALMYWIKNRLFAKLMGKRTLAKLFLRYKGLSSEAVQSYF
ncbi:MAG TPA: glycosyltransferase family A protein [Flavobacterium sp.]|jgi:hypothetical protein